MQQRIAGVHKFHDAELGRYSQCGAMATLLSGVAASAVGERLMVRLEKDFFPKYTIVPYEADGRPGKF